jgi:hypothetical protein
MWYYSKTFKKLIQQASHYSHRPGVAQQGFPQIGCLFTFPLLLGDTLLYDTCNSHGMSGVMYTIFRLILIRRKSMVVLPPTLQ